MLWSFLVESMLKRNLVFVPFAAWRRDRLLVHLVHLLGNAGNFTFCLIADHFVLFNCNYEIGIAPRKVSPSYRNYVTRERLLIDGCWRDSATPLIADHMIHLRARATKRRAARYSNDRNGLFVQWGRLFSLSSGIRWQCCVWWQQTLNRVNSILYKWSF